MLICLQNRLFGFTSCKGTTKFADVQENGKKIAIFWIMDAHEGYGTALAAEKADN